MADREINIKVKGKAEGLGVFDKVREKLEGIKRVAGGRSTTKELFETLAGGGAVAGLTFIANELADAAQSAGKMALEMSGVNAEEKDWTAEIIKSIPLVGIGGKLGEGIRDMVAGIGRAVGASEDFVSRWANASTYIEDARAAIEKVNHIKGVGDAIGSVTGSFVQRSNDATYKGRELIDLNQDSKESKDALAIAEQRRNLDQDLTLSPEVRAAMERNIDQAEKAMNRAHKAERRKIEEDDRGDRAKQAMDDQTKIEAVRSQARQIGLKEQGKDLEAIKEQNRQAADAQIEQIKRISAEQERKNPERTNEIDERALRQIDAARELQKAQDAAAEREQKNASLDRSVQINRDVRDAKIEGLRVEAELGGQVKQIELERAQINEKFQQKREDINKKLREDVHLTAEQRDRYKEILAGLDVQEKKEQMIAALKRNTLPENTQTRGVGISNIGGAFAAAFERQQADVLGTFGAVSGGGATAGQGITGVGGGAAASLAAGQSAALAGGKPAGGLAFTGQQNLFAPADATAKNTKASADKLDKLVAAQTAHTEALKLLAAALAQGAAPSGIFN